MAMMVVTLNCMPGNVCQKIGTILYVIFTSNVLFLCKSFQTYLEDIRKYAGQFSKFGNYSYKWNAELALFL